MKSLLVFIFLLSIGTAQACSCWGPQDFCSTVSDSIVDSDYVILGKKIVNKEHGMIVQVLRSYRNEIEDKAITIWGDLGWLCREYTSGFAVGDTFVFHVHMIGESMFHPSESREDFSLSFCGLNYLRVKNNRVEGFINQSEVNQVVSLNTFNYYFGRDECMSIRFNDFSIEATVGPNPFSEIISVTSSHEMLRLELYDLLGRLIHEEDVTGRLSYELSLADRGLISGTYILRIVGYRSEDKLIKIIKV